MSPTCVICRLFLSSNQGRGVSWDHGDREKLSTTLVYSPEVCLIRKYAAQLIVFGSFAGFSWLAMQAVHELGHVMGALFTGGSVQRVILHPLAISRTDVYPNPHPLAVVWAGPLVGVLLPGMMFFIARTLRAADVVIARAFAGFCCIANGAYIGADLFFRVADGADLLQFGARPWQLGLFSISAIAAGLYLWQGTGWYFGFGPAQGRVCPRAMYIMPRLFFSTASINFFIHSIQGYLRVWSG